MIVNDKRALQLRSSGITSSRSRLLRLQSGVDGMLLRKETGQLRVRGEMPRRAQRTFAMRWHVFSTSPISLCTSLLHSFSTSSPVFGLTNVTIPAGRSIFA